MKRVYLLDAESQNGNFEHMLPQKLFERSEHPDAAQFQSASQERIKRTTANIAVVRFRH